jgi:streptogramin lyase
MAWSALPDGEIRARQPGGEPYVLADKLPLINPLGYTADGRLFAAQIGIDRFLEIDVSGTEKPRLVARGIGHLNSFQITADDQLYGPLAGLEQLAQIDLASGDITVIADSSGMLSAVSLNSTGQIYAVGWISGELLRFDIDADTGVGTAVLVAQLEPPLDNLAIDADDMIYVSQPATGTIVKVDPASGAQTTVVPGNLGIPGGLAITMHKGRETLIVADDFGFRHVDTQTGEVYATIDLTEFMDPLAATAAAVNADVIVLSDVSRARVYMVDRTTNQTVHKWKNIDTPYGLVLTASGEPIVAEYASGTLIQLSTTDRTSRQIIATGLDGPVGLAWAGPDALYVSETRSGAITRIDINTGAKVLVTGGLDRPEGLTVLADGHLTVVEVGARRVIEIDPDHGTRVVLADALPVGAVTPLHPAPVHTPSGIAAGSDGSLYVSSDEDHSILRLVR